MFLESVSITYVVQTTNIIGVGMPFIIYRTQLQKNNIK